MFTKLILIHDNVKDKDFILNNTLSDTLILPFNNINSITNTISKYSINRLSFLFHNDNTITSDILINNINLVRKIAHINEIDLITCNGNKLGVELENVYNIPINYSSLYIGYNRWFLDNNKIELEGLYITEGINEYGFHLGTPNYEWNEIRKLTATNGNPDDSYGRAVAVYGNTYAISAPQEDSFNIGVQNAESTDNSSSNTGAVYIYERDNSNNFTFKHLIKPPYIQSGSNAPLLQFATQLALYDDTLAASSIFGQGSIGAVFVYRKNAQGIWSYLNTINSPAGSGGDNFGCSLVINKIDTTLLLAIGANSEDSSGVGVINGMTSNMLNETSNQSGAVYIFRELNNNNRWDLEAYIKPQEATAAIISPHYFGQSLAMDNGVLAVGAPGSKINAGTGNSEGSVFIYNRNNLNNQWSYLTRLTHPYRTTGTSTIFQNDMFGFSIGLKDNVLAISYKDDTDISGVLNATQLVSNSSKFNTDNTAFQDSGAVIVYRFNGTTWAVEALLKADRNTMSPTSPLNFGINSFFASNSYLPKLVDVDTNYIIVGCPGQNMPFAGINTASAGTSITNAGAAYVFKYENNAWAQDVYLKASDAAASNFFGIAVAIQNNNILVGANGTTTTNGAAYVYGRKGTPTYNIDLSYMSYVKGDFRTTGSNPPYGQFGVSVASYNHYVAVGSVNNTEQHINVDNVGVVSSFSGGSRVNGSGAVYLYRMYYNGTKYVFNPLSREGYSKFRDFNNNLHTGGNSFGTIVDLHRFNNILILAVGAPGERGTSHASYTPSLNSSQKSFNTNTNAGSVYIYTYPLTTDNDDITKNNFVSDPIESGWLKAYTSSNPMNIYTEEQASANFGQALALYENTIVVGSPNRTELSRVVAGAVYIYRAQYRSGSTTTLQWNIFQKIIAPDAQANNLFGNSVAIYDKTIVIAARGRNSNTGAIYVYELNTQGTSYEHKQTLTANNAGTGDSFGFSVSIYGNTIAVSAPQEDGDATTINGTSNDNKSNSGAVYIFKKNTSTNIWSQEAYVKAWNSDPSDHFGGNSLSYINTPVNQTIKLYDESSLAITAYSEQSVTSTDINPIYANNNAATNRGAVYLYKKDTSAWALSSYIKPVTEISLLQQSGFGVSISASNIINSNEKVLYIGSLDSASSEINERPFGSAGTALVGGVFAYKLTDGLITTKPITDITSNSFKSGGTILEKGDGTELKYGIVWGTSDAPFVELPTKTEIKATIAVGAAIPDFNSEALIGILPNTTYYVRAYLTRTSNGITQTKYGNQLTFITLLQFYPPTVTLTITSKSINTINIIGNITNNGGKPIVKYGVIWGLSSNLDPLYETAGLNKIEDQGNLSGEYNKEITGLVGGTEYKIRAFAENAEGISYSSIQLVTTNAPLTIPEVVTFLPTEITSGSFKARGEITSNGNTTITEYGFIYKKDVSLNTIEYPLPGATDIQIESSTDNKIGLFNRVIPSLDPDSRYIYRAYAKNSVGISYGVTQSLITSSFIAYTDPQLVTIINSITTTTINTGGNIISTGNIDIKEYGIIASNTPTFDLSTSGIIKQTINGTIIGVYNISLTSLFSNTTYYIKAYAINNADRTGYGQVITVTTKALAELPVITTYISNITETSISGEGDITFNGNAEVIEYGYIYSQQESEPTLLTTNTTIVQSGTTNIIGKYSFTQSSLLSNTQYHIRVYVKNKDINNVERIGYGNIITFTTNTSFTDPQILSEVISYTSNTITAGGNILFNGNGTVTDYGILLSDNSTVTDFKFSDINGTTIKKYQNIPLDNNKLGSYNVIISSLVSNTPYRVRAYVKSEKSGEQDRFAYGAIIEVTTAPNAPIQSPQVITLISSIGDTELEAGGKIISNGNSPIVEYGIILSKITVSNTNINPSLDDVNGSSIIKLLTSNYDLLGTFTKIKNDLEINTVYYVRAYAKNNGIGINPGYGTSIQFRTLPSLVVALPQITTLEVSSISSSSFRCGGDITSRGNTSITEYGLIWNTGYTDINTATTSLLESVTAVANKYKVENNDIIGQYGVLLTDKLPNTKYYIRAYAKNSVGTSHGQVIEVTTLPLIVIGLPQVTTTITQIYTNRVTGAVNILSNGNLGIEEYGFIWSKTSDIANPILQDTLGGNPKAFNHKTIINPSEQIVGTYSREAQPLESNVLYSIVAYAKNSAGISYGERYRLTTLSDEIPTLPNILTTIASITSTTIVSGGNIISTGNSSIIEYGLVWIEKVDGSNIEPTIDNNKIIRQSNIIGRFTETITGLQQNKTYNIRAFCKNNAYPTTYVYGNLQTITTSLSNTTGDPVVLTKEVSLITSSSFKCGGDITSNGNSDILEYGVIYSSDITKALTLENVTNFPQIVKKTVNTDNRQGEYFENISSGIISNKDYIIRAYAKNIANKIGYGNQLQFTTLENIVKIIPTVSTSITQLTVNSITGGGTIISNGFDVIEEYGLIYSAESVINPTIDNVIAVTPTAFKVAITTNLIQVGRFTSSIVGLNAGTIYNVRAYAKNSIGFGYGSTYTLVTTSALVIVRPSIKTEVSTVTATSILAGGTVLSNGNGIITQYGIIWAKTSYLTSVSKTLEIGNIDNTAALNADNIYQKILIGDIASTFSRELSPLISGTEYQVRAYATNSNGIGYGDILIVSTNSVTEITAPTVITLNVPEADIKTNSIIVTGNITSNGNQQIQKYGFKISNSLTDELIEINENYIGIFSREISGTASGITLISNNIYNIQAFARNPTGLVFGNIISITTNPTLSTNAVSNLTSDAFTGSGFITSVGNGVITEYGIIWSIDAIPTYSLSTKIVKTTNIPNPINTPFSITLPPNSLLSDVVYYYRVFAKNKDGIGYGNIVSLRTPVCPGAPIDPYLLSSTMPENGTIEGDSPEEITDKDIITTLYKKYKGYVNTNTDTDISVEYQTNAQPISFANQIATQKVPVFGIPSTYNIDNTDLKEQFSDEIIKDSPNLVVTIDDKFNSTLFAGGTRNVWKEYCYIIYYSKIPLKSIPTNPGRSFNFHSQLLNMLTSIIPVNTAFVSETNRYNIKVEKKISDTPEKWVEIAPSNYILDKDAGVLTIYEKNSVVNGTNPPRISFWRYEGITLDNPGSILPPEIPPGSLLFKSSGGAISGTQVFAVDTTSKTLQIDGNVNMTGVLDPLGVVLIPTEVHPLPNTDERYPTTMWYSNVTEQMYIGDRAIYTYNYDELGPNFKGPTGPTGANGSGSGGGGGIYANDTWISGNFLDAPPAPTNATAAATTINLDIEWNNPNRIELAILPIKIPHITRMYITVDYIGNTGQPYEVLNTSDVSTLITNLIIINGTGTSSRSDNTYTWYKNDNILTAPLTVKIWFTNHTTKTPNILTISNLSFLSGGAPSKPVITLSGNTGITSINVQLKKGLFTDSSIPNNAPSIIGYTVTYSAQTSKRKGGIFNSSHTNTINVNSNIGTDSDYTTIAEINNLYPGTTYSLNSTTTNSFGLASQLSDTLTNIETQFPTLGNTINNIDLSIYYASQYNTGYINGISYSEPIMNVANIWPLNTSTVSTLYITNNPINTQSKLFAFITNTNTSTNTEISNITYTDLTTQNPIQTVNNATDGIMVMSTNGNITDPYTNESSGFYWTVGFRAQIGANKLVAQASKYVLKLNQELYNSSGLLETIPSSGYREIDFFVDNLPLNTAPTISGYTINNTSTLQQISGVWVCSGVWSLEVSNVQTQNVVRFFHADKLLTFSFANSSTHPTIFQDLLTSFQGNGSTSNTFLTTPITKTSSSTDIVYRFQPQITITAKNINVTNNTASLSQTINIIIDNPSATLLGQMNNDSEPTGLLYGKLMSVSNASDILLGSQIGNFRNSYDHSIALSTTVNTNGYNSLQLVNGKFMTRAFTGTGSNGAYKDYRNISSGPNYLALGSETRYRWVAFRWRRALGQIKTLRFTIDGIEGSDSSLSKDPTTSKVLTASGKEIKFYYRTEDQSKSSGDPSDLEDTQNAAGGSISTVWINANKIDENQFSQYAGKLSYSGLIGGITNSTKITLGPGTIQYDVISYNFNLGSTPVYIYGLIGLPMDSNIAFKGVKCTVTVV